MPDRTSVDLKTVSYVYQRYSIKMCGNHCEDAWSISDMLFESWTELITGLDLKPRTCHVNLLPSLLTTSGGRIPNLEKSWPYWQTCDRFQSCGMNFTLFVGLVERQLVLLGAEGEAVMGCDLWVTD